MASEAGSCHICTRVGDGDRIEFKYLYKGFVSGKEKVPEIRRCGEQGIYEMVSGIIN